MCLLAAHQRLSKSVICWCCKWIWLARWRRGEYRRKSHLINAEAEQHNQPNSECISILLLLRCRSREFIVTAISPAEDKCFNGKLRCKWVSTDSIHLPFYSIKVRLQHSPGNSGHRAPSHPCVYRKCGLRKHWEYIWLTEMLLRFDLNAQHRQADTELRFDYFFLFVTHFQVQKERWKLK